MFKRRKELKAEINLLKFQKEELEHKSNEDAIRISILEGQCELLEGVQNQLCAATKKVEKLTKQVERQKKLSCDLGQTIAAYRFKHGNLSKEDFAAYKESKANEKKEDHDPYPEE